MKEWYNCVFVDLELPRIILFLKLAVNDGLRLPGVTEKWPRDMLPSGGPAKINNDPTHPSQHCRLQHALSLTLPSSIFSHGLYGVNLIIISQLDLSLLRLRVSGKVLTEAGALEFVLLHYSDALFFTFLVFLNILKQHE